MTEWETKNGHVTYKESADKLPAISKYYDYDNGAPGKSAQANGITLYLPLRRCPADVRRASTVPQNSVNAQALDAIQKSTETCRLCTRPADHNY